MNPDEQHDHDVKQTKQFRKDLDTLLQNLKHGPGHDGSPPQRQSRERSLSATKIQEAIMWLGMDLKALNEPNPYPESKNPGSAKIEPTADGLKL